MFSSLFPDLFPVMVFCPESQVMRSDYAITSHELFSTMILLLLLT